MYLSVTDDEGEGFGEGFGGGFGDDRTGGGGDGSDQQNLQQELVQIQTQFTARAKAELRQQRQNGVDLRRQVAALEKGRGRDRAEIARLQAEMKSMMQESLGCQRGLEEKDQQLEEAWRVQEVQWDADDCFTGCFGCGKGFSFVRRRHHCRACRHIFCSHCAPAGNKARLCYAGQDGMAAADEKGGAPATTAAVRLCNACFHPPGWVETDPSAAAVSSSCSPLRSPRFGSCYSRNEQQYEDEDGFLRVAEEAPEGKALPGADFQRC
jgi:hypothetical protein